MLSSKFKLCNNLTKTEDLSEFTGNFNSKSLFFRLINSFLQIDQSFFFIFTLDYLNDVYGNLAMVNYPYSTNFLAPLPPNPVTEFCARINATYNDDQVLDVSIALQYVFAFIYHIFSILQALYNALQVYSNYTGQIKCLDIKSAYDVSMGAQGWDFQVCIIFCKNEVFSSNHNRS